MKIKKYSVIIICALLLAVLCCAVACNTHDHVYTWAQTTAPTCEGEGVETGTCSCGNVTTRPVTPVGHKWGEYVVTENPTENTTGTITATCKKDATHKHNASIPALTNSAYTSSSDANGFNFEYKINVVDEITGPLGQQVVFNICVHKHSIDWEILEEPTCLSDGKRKGTCSHELCGEVFEEVMPKLPHVWSDPQIVTPPTANNSGSACVVCENDKERTHSREYVLPPLSTSWENHFIEGDPKECLYTGYTGSVDPEDSTVTNYEMTVYDPFQDYDCGPQTLTITVPLSSSDHVHIFGEYEIVTMPSGNQNGKATASCLLVPEHTHSITLPSFNNTLSENNNYKYEIVGNTVNWTIDRKGYGNQTKTFTGSYELPTSIAIKTSDYPVSQLSEEYNDGDTIPLKVGDNFKATFIVTTPLNGKNAASLELTCTDVDGNTVPISRDMLQSTAYQDQGMLLDARLINNGYTFYVKDYCPNVHYLTLDAGNGLKSTFTIEPVLSAPSGKGKDVLKPQIYNVKQGEWNFVKGTQSVYIGAEITVGTSAELYSDPSSMVTVFNALGEDVTAKCIAREGTFGGKAGFVFSSVDSETYTVRFTSTRTPSHSVSITVDVNGYPKPSDLFNDLYYYSYSTNNKKYTVEYSDIVNDDEAGTSSGKATLTIVGRGSRTVPFTFEYADGKCTFVGPDNSDYNLKINNNFELILSEYDEFEEIEIDYTFDKIAYFTNSIVGSYVFANNTNTESSEMKVILTVNKAGVYKFSVTGNRLCININNDAIPQSIDDCDYSIGRYNGSGVSEKEITLNEGDVILIYNYPQMNSTLTITFVSEVAEN